MPANRRPNGASIPTTIRLSPDIYYELRTLMCDPRSGAIRYATWGALFETLAREYLDRQKIAASPTEDDLPPDGSAAPIRAPLLRRQS